MRSSIGDIFARETPKMRKAAVIAAVTALLLKGATAADIGIPAPGASQTDDAGQAARHGGQHGGGGRGHGGGDGGGDGGGSVIIGFPYPSGPGAPYPPARIPTPARSRLGHLVGHPLPATVLPANLGHGPSGTIATSLAATILM